MLTQTIDAEGERSLGELAGHGPLPPSVFERLACTADLAGVVFGQSGQPLWISRDKRQITPAQWRALVARDQGCVITGAPPDECEAHHKIPWNCRLAGRSDMDNYVLLARSFHRWLHDNNRTLVQATDGSWSHRPATADELPIDRRVNARAP